MIYGRAGIGAGAIFMFRRRELKEEVQHPNENTVSLAGLDYLDVVKAEFH